MLRVAHVEPENVRARRHQFLQHVSVFSVAGPSVQMIFVLRIPRIRIPNARRKAISIKPRSQQRGGKAIS